MSAEPDDLSDWLKELSHTHTDEPICPHCGAVQKDAWEHFTADSSECAETECGSCERDIVISQHISVTYSTKKGKP